MMTEDQILNIYWQEMERFQYQLDNGIIDDMTYYAEVEYLEEWYRDKMREEKR